jgi:AraC-like DNA-binding protein
MFSYELPIDKPINYSVTGKFEALTPDWKHQNFPLADYELFVITKGTLYISYREVTYMVREGEALLLPPSEPPNNRRNGVKPSSCSFYWLHFTCGEEVVERDISSTWELGGTNNDRIYVPAQAMLRNPEKVLVLMKQLQDQARSNYSKAALNYMTTSILCEICHQVFESQTIEGSRKGKLQMYQDIVDYVKRNANQNIKVYDVAEHFGYNEKYLSHLFVEIAGISLKQYILKFKVETANFLLSDTNQTINEIAAATGYTDSHNFMKVYKKITGLTPSEYRNAFSKRLLFHE